MAQSSAVLLVCAPSSTAQACRLVTYTLQPDCFRSNPAADCAFDAAHPDFGPQIAVWVEDAAGGFVDTLMVTSAVAIHGIGNRPGVWDMRSGPRFPYGRRQMALPIWAHARGHLYDLVVMEDARDDRMTGHEDNSSPEPHFCRPMQAGEIVDAITCPSGTFRSCKGKLDPAMPRSYYPPAGRPPRLRKRALRDPAAVHRILRSRRLGPVRLPERRRRGCGRDAAVRARRSPGRGSFPTRLPTATTPCSSRSRRSSTPTPRTSTRRSFRPDEAAAFNEYGLQRKHGRAVGAVPCSVFVGPGARRAAAIDIAGYGDWTGASGDVHAPDGTIGARSRAAAPAGWR